MRTAVFALWALAGALSAQQVPSVDLGAIDKSVDPCQNFYQYACGTWMKNNPIPSDQSRWVRFSELAERNRLILKQILEDAAKPNPQRTVVEQQIGDYYASCMDEEGIEAKGIKPLQPTLQRIAKLKNADDVSSEVGRLHKEGVRAFFNLFSRPDPKNAQINILNADQGGLGLPDRDYYLKSDPKSVETRKAYQEHVQAMLTLLGHTPELAAQEAAQVVALETKLAQGSRDRVARRDPNKQYNKMTVQEFAALSPSVSWGRYARELGVLPTPTLNVSVPEFFQTLEGVMKESGIPAIQAYLIWQVVHDAAAQLPKAFVAENFNFYSKTLAGVKEMPVRWKRCVLSTDRALGEALGQKYVQVAFSAEGKKRTLEMVDEIEKAMAKDIQSLAWMSPATKDAALSKLHLVTNKIGYPEKWRDYSSAKVERGDFVGNSDRLSAFEVRRNLNKIGKPVDKSEWSMTPPTVNAYYNPPQNNINFPAGILQPPFYEAKRDDAANYGAIGAVVGHELTHGFDDQGRQYDGAGNLRDWWTAADAKEFKDRADCIVNEYGNFVATGDVKLNGRLTLGENAADNGGIRLAYIALMESLAAKTVSNDKLDGYTPQQRFFLGFGQIWCGNATEQAARLQALTDPHSPGQYRVNGVVQNMPEFGQAFGCKVGQPMVTEKACRVW